MEKITDKKELVQRFRTEAILDAAIKVIALRGLDKATLEQVAAEAGISKATIYLYFRNKEDLYYQCVVDRFRRITATMKEAAADVDDPVERIRVLITAQTHAIETNADFFRVFLTERLGFFLDQSTEFGQGFRQLHDEYSSMIIDALREGMDRGVLRDMDPVKAFYLLFSMVRGMAMHGIICECGISGDGPARPLDAGLILDTFFNGIMKYTG